MICAKESRGVIGLIKYFPARIYSCLGRVPLIRLLLAEEIRLGAGMPLMLFIEGKCFFVKSSGELTLKAAEGIRISLDEIGEIFRMLLEGTVYAAEENIKEGYITAEGGHRVGICGSVSLDGGKIGNFKYISYLNIRIAHEVIGSSELLFAGIFSEGPENCLVISPPGGGKTTVLRDISRVLGSSPKFDCKIGIADERGELAAVHNGIAMNDIGVRSCVIDGCPKAQAMEIMLRCMGVNVIITDEIGSSEEEEKAIKKLMNCGVKVIASMHAASLDEVKRRFGHMIGAGGFDNIVRLENKQIREMIRLDG